MLILFFFDSKNFLDDAVQKIFDNREFLDDTKSKVLQPLKNFPVWI
ncbi:hypothetical protein GGD38_003464 [Chitinophagaceae bacterium OAS944]|nr:hypothetical protein [Chitinophagaceae bacterium OAS944]